MVRYAASTATVHVTEQSSGPDGSGAGSGTPDPGTPSTFPTGVVVAAGIGLLALVIIMARR